MRARPDSFSFFLVFVPCAAIGYQHINHDQGGTDTNCTICHVEGGIVPCADVEIHEINHIASHDTVDDIAEGASHNQTERNRHETVSMRMAPHPDQDTNRHSHTQTHE